VKAATSTASSAAVLGCGDAQEKGAANRKLY
jgi:hypothetical protein